jgi:ribose transport system substrate-binding protein
VVTNDQTAYGRLGAEALFKKLGGKGSVVEMRGIAGVPADADRHEGFTEALKNSPEIKVVASVFTGWSPDKGAQETKNLISSGKQIDGIWTSGIDKAVVDAYKTANIKYVPVVGADNNGFMGQEIDLKDAGLVGINVTNPPAVGGAGLSIALDVLAGKKVPRVTHLTPKVYDSSTAEGMKWLKSLYDPKVDPNYPVYSPVALHHRAGEGLQRPGRMRLAIRRTFIAPGERAFWSISGWSSSLRECPVCAAIRRRRVCN